MARGLILWANVWWKEVSASCSSSALDRLVGTIFAYDGRATSNSSVLRPHCARRAENAGAVYCEVTLRITEATEEENAAHLRD